MNQKIYMKKTYFQNFSWFQFYVYKLRMIMCNTGIDYCVKFSLADVKLLSFYEEMI